MMKRFPLLLSLATLIVLAGCKRDNSDTLTPAEEEQAARFSSASETETEVVFNDVFDNVMGVNAELGIGGTGIFGRMANPSGNPGGRSERGLGLDSLPSCVTVTITRLNLPNLFPVRVVIDFGTTGCTGNDGRVRYGKVITEYTGRLVIPGSVATTRFENFRVDSVSVQGQHRVANTTPPAGNQRRFQVNVTDARLTRPSGNYVQWNSERIVTQVEGNLTPLPQDDLFSITGGGHGRVRRGNLIVAFQSQIVEPLRKRFICRWISRGLIRVWRETLPANSPWVATLNYGDGQCDPLATLTINGQSQVIQLPH